MARLPVPHKDVDNWGYVLNEYLLRSHADDGTLKDGTVGAAQLQDGAVTSSKLAKGAVTVQASDGDGHALQVNNAQSGTIMKVSSDKVQATVPVVAPNLPRKISVGKTPPLNPQEGDIWFDTRGTEA